MRILIAGCGYVGAPLAQSFCDDGHEVFCIRRSRGEDGEAWFTLPMDLTQPIDADLLPTDLDAIYYLPASRDRDAKALDDLYAAGPTHLAQAASMSSMGFRFIMVSTTGVYAQTDGSEVDEGSNAWGSTASSKALLRGEHMVARLPNQVILRFSGIYGPGRHRLIRQVREGTPVPEALQGRYLNQIHRDDCIGTLRFVLDHEAPPKVLVASDIAPTLRSEVLEWLAGELGSAPPPVAGEAPSGGRGQTNKRCNSQKIRDLGYTFTYPTFKEGYAKILRDEC